MKNDRPKEIAKLVLHELQASPEKFTAYVKANVDGQERVYFIVRGNTPLPSEHSFSTPNSQFANYLAPMGRIASLRVNDAEAIPLPKRIARVSVIEKDDFRIKSQDGRFDAIDNVISIDRQTLRVQSLTKFLKGQAKQPDADSPVQARIVEGFSLRDKPILDEIQDELFRLPIASQIILTGAPGTGKTTTLIKRLAQKTSPEFIEEELDGITDEQKTVLFDRDKSWILFSPSDLLKEYLKESLSKEGFPANNNSVVTWDNVRRTLARDVLKILKSGNQGHFTQKDLALLCARSSAETTEYAEEFFAFFQSRIRNDAEEEIDAISQIESSLIWKEPIYISLAKRCEPFIGEIKKQRDSKRSNLELFESLTRVKEDKDKIEHSLTTVIKELKDALTDSTQSSAKLKGLIGQIKWKLQEDAKGTFASLLDELAKFSEEAIESKVKGAMDALSVLRKRLQEIKWVFEGYVKRIEAVPQIYQEFRQLLLREKNQSYLNRDYENEIKQTRISTAEVDILVFLMLREARSLFSNDSSLLYRKSSSDILEGIKDYYRTSVVVDEAPDFSAIQLGCMAYLSHPKFTSVSLSGDLMQRVTLNGIASWQECEIYSKRFEVHVLDRAYRQSSRLLGLAAKLYQNSMNEPAGFVSAFEPTQQDPSPLKLHAKDRRSLGAWLSERVLEIYELNKRRLPSIAVLVSSEEEVSQIYDAIYEPLNEQSIEVEKCPEGKVLGTEAKVRIFSLNYIKGLEFGGVFLIGIDRIAAKHPALVDRYLYVSLTRATTFLGVTYETAFPEQLKIVETDFEDGNWKILAKK